MSAPLKILTQLRDLAFSSCLVLLITSGLCSADIRLLVSFTGNQPKVEKIMYDTGGQYLPAAKRQKKPDSASTALKRRFDQEVRSDFALVVWTDSSGLIIQTDRIRDPRIIHAPVGSATMESQLTYKFQQEGVFLLRGPDSARSVEVIFPALALRDRQNSEAALPGVHWAWTLDH